MQTNEDITVESASSFAVAKEEWNALLQGSGFKSIFQTYQWNECRRKYFHENKKLVLLSCRSGNELVGIMPFVQYKWSPIKGVPGFKVLEFLGAPDSDYNDFIIKKEMYSTVLDTCFKWLSRNSNLWHIIALQEVAEDSPTNGFLKKACSKNNLSLSSRNQSICPQIILPKNYNDFESNLSRNSRGNIRRKKKQLAAAGLATFETGTPQDMERFFALYQYRWGEMPQQHKLFHEAVSKRLEKHLNLTFVVLDGEKIAVQYCYDFNNTRCLYLSGFNTKHRDLSPGVALLAKNIAGAIESGASTYDFMRGNEQYKLHYANRICINKLYTISRSSFMLTTYRLIKNISEKTRTFFRLKQWRKLYPQNIYPTIKSIANRLPAR